MPAAGSRRMHLPPPISMHFASSHHAKHKGYSNEAESRYACHGEPVRLTGYRIVADGHVRLPVLVRRTSTLRAFNKLPVTHHWAHELGTKRACHSALETFSPASRPNRWSLDRGQKCRRSRA